MKTKKGTEMKERIFLLSALGLMSCFCCVFAEEDPETLRQKARELKKQKDYHNKEKNRLEKEVRRLEAKASILANRDKIDEAIEAMKFVKPKKPRKLLIYSRTKGFRHKSIPMGVHVLTELGKRTDTYKALATEDPQIFTSGMLDKFDGILMLNSTGDEAIPRGKAREAFEAFLQKDKGLIGIHASTDCHKNWENYREAMGGLFDGHPWGAGSLVTLYNEEPKHPICRHVESGYQIKDEIYQYKDDKHFTRNKLRILLSLDLSGEKMKKGGMKRKDYDYAVTWVRKYAGSRVFYSNLGHNDYTYYNKVALQQYLNGIQFALGDLEADARPSAEVGNGTPKAPPAGF